MEVKGAAFLYTLAALMVTFAGFAALLLTLRPASGAKLSRLDKYLANTIMTHVFVLTAGALLPPLLALFDLPEASIWRIAAVLFGLPMLLIQTTYPHRRRKVIGTWPPRPIFAVFVVLGALATLTMLVYVLGGFPCCAAVYATAVTVDFFSVVFGYAIALNMILEQPLDM